MGADLLEKLPKGTPKWSIGLAVLIIVSGVIGVALYNTVKSEVQEYMKAQIETSRITVTAEATVTGSIMRLAQENAIQITQLSGALLKAQEQNSELLVRVGNIEKDLAVSKEKATACEEKLAQYKK